MVTDNGNFYVDVSSTVACVAVATVNNAALLLEPTGEYGGRLPSIPMHRASVAFQVTVSSGMFCRLPDGRWGDVKRVLVQEQQVALIYHEHRLLLGT